MRTVRILEEASQEAIEAAAWYEFEQAGLGVELAREHTPVRFDMRGSGLSDHYVAEQGV